MANTVIQLKHSTVQGNIPVSLANGEISINTRDGKLFYADPTGTIQEFSEFPGPSGLDTEIQFNDSGVLGSDSDLTYNKTTDVLGVKNIVVSGNNYFGNANLHEGITQLSVTNNGASAYLFDQYTGNNPSLYVGAGETLSFNLNVSGHPFVIRESSGGANTSAGLTHISTTGVVSTGTDAQGKVSGVLFWKVPFSLVGSTYVYQCTIHGGMVGNIVIQQPASFVAANTTLAFNTANAAFLAANAATATDTTQNNSITASFTAANSAGVYANGAFAAANTADTKATSAGVYANGAFTRANNSLNANTGGTITGNVTISANLTASNVATQTYIQFGDGSKQYTANAGSGGGTTDQVARNTANAAFIHANAAFNAANTSSGGGNSFGRIYTSNNSTFANATVSSDQITFTGVDGVSVAANSITKTIVFAGTPGAQGLTVDYGLVTESIAYSLDYGTL